MRNQVTNMSRKAGVVVWRRADNGTGTLEGTLEILLITARRHPDSWIFPVGTVDPGETLQQAAARECAEESGYTVEVGSLLAEIIVPKEADQTPASGTVDSQHFTFFAAQLTGELSTYETDRQRRWVSLPQLLACIAPVFARVARAAREVLPH
jgi:8-oxo-dGTP pyrophosphatase MutT (NUDIX family)